VFHLNGGNDLAMVLISAMRIRLLVKQLLSVAKVQQKLRLTKMQFIFYDLFSVMI